MGDLDSVCLVVHQQDVELRRVGHVLAAKKRQPGPWEMLGPSAAECEAHEFFETVRHHVLGLLVGAVTNPISERKTSQSERPNRAQLLAENRTLAWGESP